MEWARDMATGDYVQSADGRPVMDTSLAPPTRLRLRAHRGKWLYAPDPDYGSDFYSYKKKRSVDLTDGLGETIAAKALEPLARDGRADSIQVETQFSQRGGVSYAATMVDRQRQEEYTVTTPVGVPG